MVCRALVQMEMHEAIRCRQSGVNRRQIADRTGLPCAASANPYEVILNRPWCQGRSKGTVEKVAELTAFLPRRRPEVDSPPIDPPHTP